MQKLITILFSDAEVVILIRQAVWNVNVCGGQLLVNIGVTPAYIVIIQPMMLATHQHSRIVIQSGQ